jgi:hypothetical protein
LNLSVVGSTAAFAGLCLALIAAPASGAPNDFNGTWKSSDATAVILSRVDIRREGAELVIHVWGKCRAMACGWGTARARLYSSSIAVPEEAAADTAIAEFNRGGVQRLLVLQLASGQIVYNSYTSFSYASSKKAGRNNFHTQGRLVRQ